MSPPRLRLITTFALFVLGLLIGVWLNAFFHDDSWPPSVQERADILVAENYLAGELTAPLPPSPHHWAQRLTELTPSETRRYGVARESAALWLAVFGGSPALAGIFAFAVAMTCVCRFGINLYPDKQVSATILGLLVMLAIANSQAWQLHDPYPWLVLIGACLFCEAWIRHAFRGEEMGSWRLAIGFSILVLSSTALAAGAAIAWIVVRIIRGERMSSKHAQASGPLLATQRGRIPVLICALLLVAFFAMRNSAATGSVWRSPESDYNGRNVTAPVWFWQTVAKPTPGIDFVLERYDELIAIPETRLPVPAYASWLETIWNGLQTSGGVALALAALFTIIASGESRALPMLAVFITLSGLALARYNMPSTWWLLITPLLVERALFGLSVFKNSQPAVVGRLHMAFVVAFLLSILFAPQVQIYGPDAAYRENRKEIVKRILETPGQHLVFVSIDPSVDAGMEPADLPRNWSQSQILFARNLKPEQNTELVAALPNHIPWNMIVFRDRIGIRLWKTPDSQAAKQSPRD